MGTSLDHPNTPKNDEIQLQACSGQPHQSCSVTSLGNWSRLFEMSAEVRAGWVCG
jgi:hypothetical protein